MDNPISKERQKLIDTINESEIKVGDNLMVKHNSVTNFPREDRKMRDEACVVTHAGKVIKVKHRDSSAKSGEYTITQDDITGRDIRRAGANPFNESADNTRSINYGLDSILFNMDIIGGKREVMKGIGENNKGKFEMSGIPVEDCNWNPFIYNKKGKKEYYQRGFVWSVEDNQLLVESIYQGIQCGRILIRLRGWAELEEMAAAGETELSFKDIVDGKQRLHAVHGFITEEYPDAQGNYFGDLSFEAQHRFTDHQLFAYAEMPERTTDEETIMQFLKLNYAGVPQSKEHILFVKEIQQKL